VIRSRLALVVCVAAVTASGCECGSKKAAKKEAPEVEPEAEEVAEAPERDRPRPRMPDRRPTRDLSGRVRRNAPLGVEEATRLMPPLDARTLVPPALSPNGRQVRFTYCVDAENIDAAAKTLVANVQGASWGKVASRAPDGATATQRHGIAAEKGDLRLSITLQAVRRSACDASVNQFFAVAALNKIAPEGEDDQSPSPEPEP
jgi:hypothetical protein